MTKYPRYSTWYDDARGHYDIVRWDDRFSFQVVQTNIRDSGKAHLALALWRQRAAITETDTNAG